MLQPMEHLPLRLLNAVHEHFDGPPDLYVAVPQRSMWVTGYRDGSAQFKLIVPDLQAQATFDRRSLRHMHSVHNRPLPGWARPVAASARLLLESDWLLQGGKFLLVGDEPLGIRYEHAMALGFLAYWHEVFGVEYDFVDLLDQVDLAVRRYLPLL